MKWSRLALFLVVVIGFIVSTNLHWGKDHWTQVLKVDARGYHAHLPAIFIYQDLQFNFFEELEMKTYFRPNITYEYRTHTPNGTVNRYFVGTAVLQAPFFLIARVWANLGGYPDDGFSRPFPLMITLAGLFYLWLGLWALNHMLRRMEINEWSRGLVIILLAFGTHLFNYSIVDPGMSHVYSFAMVSLFLLLGHRFFHGNISSEGSVPLSFSECKSVLLSMAIVFGLICLIRPVNGIAIFALPVVAGSFRDLITGLKRLNNSYAVLGLCVVVYACIAGIQPLLYKFQTGQFWVASYGDEGFNWTDPHMLDILFSYKKGLFVYTPMLFIGLFGLVFVWRKERFQALSFIAFLILVTYVLSSWWSWWYGGSFSSRPFVEYIPVLAIPLAFLLYGVGRGTRRVILPVAFLILALNQFQTYQYRYYIIHWDSMDKELYWDVFLSMEKPTESLGIPSN